MRHARLFALLALAGCADMGDSGGRSATGALGGVAQGAVAGGVAGSFSGDAGWGAPVGVGAGAGLLYDRSQQQPPGYGSGGAYRGNEPAY